MNTERNLQLQNWNNFCQYHLGDWYGFWTRYSPQGECLKSFKCVRSFHLNTDANQVDQVNTYTYSDGRTEKKVFPSHQLSVTKALFLDRGFSFGSTSLNKDTVFGFETALKHENSRVSAAVIYAPNLKLQRLTLIVEELASFPTEITYSPTDRAKDNWQGTQWILTPDLVMSLPKSAKWSRLEDWGNDYLILHQGGVSISCPQQLESCKEFVLVVDWQVNDTLLQRGIRHFSTSGFTGFFLEFFSPK